MLVSYLARLAATHVRTVRAAPLTALEEARLPLRVWPDEVDAYLHLNNGRYLTMMDAGRYQLFLRTRLWQEMRKRGWSPVLGSAAVRFLRELRPLQEVELVTRIAGWNERWLYIEHRLEREGRVHALAGVRVVTRDGKRRVPPAELLATVGFEGEAPEPPAIVDGLMRIDTA